MRAGCSCDSCDYDEEADGENYSLKREIAFLAAAGVAFGLGLLAKSGNLLALASFPALDDLFFMAAYLLAARDVLLGAAKNIVHGRVFDELFLMSVATLGAIAIGRYEEALGVMVFYKIGEALQKKASEKSRSSVRALLALRPSEARLRRDGAWVLLDPEEARVGDEFMVLPGERVPLDGRVVEGETFVDSSSLTGESLPRRVAVGDELLAGTVATDGSLIAIALTAANQSAASRIIELVEGAARSKSKAGRFITRFAAVYTPIVVGAAGLLAFIPPLFFGQSLAGWTYRALVLLVISCPCALVISVPLGYFCGMGGAAKRGILVKNAEVLDVLARAQTVVFDKTGTLTSGNFELRSIEAEIGFSVDEVLAIAAAAESRSRHPLATSIRTAAAARGLSIGVEDEASGIEERPGAGVVAYVGGRRVLAGNDRLLDLEGVPRNGRTSDGTTINISVDGVLAGRITAGDAPKPDAKEALSALRALGATRTVMLTGDSRAAAEPIARMLGIEEVAADLLPGDKLSYLEKVVAKTSALGGSTVFIGDGMNDAPSLARADVGVAMGAGSDAAVEQADLVLMTNEVARLPEALHRARRTRSVVTQGIVLCLVVKAVFLALGAMGIAPMWEAVIADVGVAILAILNALRALR
jgi:Cd2+/Zn2+-exporting ATPase